MKLGTRVLMLSGDESALRLRALREALVAAGVEPDDIEISRLDGALDPGEWLAQAATAPFLTEKRIVVVRNALRSECPKGFESRLAGLPEWSLVILVADEETGDDSRQQRLKTIRKAWEAAVTAGGGKVESFDVGPKEVLAAIKKEASRLNKAISDRSAQLLSDMTGASLSRSIEELEKLSIYVGESDTIREGDIQALVVAAKEWNVFKLVDAIVHDNAAGAIRQLRILIGSPLKAEEAAFRSILPMLSRQMRLLWQARACIEAKVSPDRAPEALARSLPVKPNITKEPPYRQSNLMASARAANYVRLAGCFKLLGEADAKLKGVLPGYSAQETLEQCVLGMVAMFSRA